MGITNKDILKTVAIDVPNMKEQLESNVGRLNNISNLITQPLGFNYYCNLENEGWNLTTFKQTIDTLKLIGVDCVSFLPYALLQNTTSSTLTTYYQYDTNLRQCIEYCISIGIKPYVKCHISLIGNQGGQSTINPTDINTFFSNLTLFEKHYASICEEYKIDIFCIGTENKIISSSNRNLWITLINQIREVYKGKVTYACNFTYSGDEQTTCCFLDQLDIIGLDNYHAISRGLTTSYDTAKMYCQDVVLPNVVNLYNTYNKPILFTEFGFGKWKGGCLIPHGENSWDYTPSNLRTQEMLNGYMAFLDTFKGVDFVNGFWYWSEKQTNNVGNAMSVLNTVEVHNYIKSLKGVK